MESRSFALQRWSYTYSQEKDHYFLSLYFNIFINSCIFFIIQPTALQTFTSLSRWWKTLRTWIVMEKTIQRSAENYYKFNVARKIQPSKCIIYLNHDDNLYQDHKCYLMVGTSKNMRMQHEDARGSRLGQL